ncbi:MAG: AraC family transcriptional regulator [Edaphocola sp.]
MRTGPCKTERVRRPKDDFLQRFLGDEAVTAEATKRTVCKGVDFYFADMLLCPNNDVPEEKAYLNFYPVADGSSYLQLSFLPECTEDADAHYRVAQLVYHPEFFAQWPASIVNGKQPFRFDRCTEQAFSLNGHAKELLEFLLAEDAPAPDFVVSLRRQEAVICLLRYALEAFVIPDEANRLPACSFLSSSTERDKVLDAERAIMASLDQPHTIKELSRQVGMNECYLKKGFKAMFGKTIHEYQQWQRIECSKEMLLQGKYSVNEVAFRMGFGSASHFSTTFKKVAGMKPCELLR